MPRDILRTFDKARRVKFNGRDQSQGLRPRPVRTVKCFLLVMSRPRFEGFRFTA